MAKAESCIVCEQQAQKSNGIIVDNTNSNDCEDNRSCDDDWITITSA